MRITLFLCLTCIALPSYCQTDCERSCNQAKLPPNYTQVQIVKARQECINRCPKSTPPKQSVFQMTTGQRQVLMNSTLNGQQLQELGPNQNAMLQTQLQEMDANRQIGIQPTDSAHAALNAGASQGQLEAAKNNYQDQFGIVKGAVQNQAKPKAYSGSAKTTTLQDPFQEPPKQADSGPDERGLANAIQNSCLTLDPVNKIAKVGHDCSTVCKKAPAVGLYPLFPDGNFIDSPAAVKRFFTLCASADATMAAVTEDEQVVAVK